MKEVMLRKKIGSYSTLKQKVTLRIERINSYATFVQQLMLKKKLRRSAVTLPLHASWS